MSYPFNRFPEDTTDWERVARARGEGAAARALPAPPRKEERLRTLLALLCGTRSGEAVETALRMYATDRDIPTVPGCGISLSERENGVLVKHIDSMMERGVWRA